MTIDFLGIGVQKAGTTWLWSALRSHPDVWMPHKKELHYFDRNCKYPSWSYLSEKYLYKRLVGKENHNKSFRFMMREDLLNALSSRNWKRIRWMMKYYLKTYSDSWYLSLFEDGIGQLRGEITPDYSLIELNDIQHIKSLVPKLKIILLLRNPIDRCWSQIRFEYTKNRFNGIDNLDSIKEMIDSPKIRKRGEYIRIIDSWRSVFGKENIFIGFYDQISSNPNELIQGVFDFLEIEALSLSQRELSTRRNVSEKKEIPDEIEFILAERYKDEVYELMSVLDNTYTYNWVKNVDFILSSKNQGGL